MPSALYFKDVDRYKQAAEDAKSELSTLWQARPADASPNGRQDHCDEEK